ncbi:hypothetical protein J3D55_000388 [Chryseobacterium ginsenosidimutans]|uniref:hypothetical protein n=1 Tax=Chryseobacterium ginsenosidimutans TaxID=687846 RepID=UPI0021684F71|nr:hypothetical protein [Chryseobacterium ginsenosidimutans]MCS3867472.1 hypothetical protein [Chryseobacterium ginsenosidimutans]
MDKIILQYHYSPGFIGDFVMKDLYISESFEFYLKFFWSYKVETLSDSDFERKQWRRFTTIKDTLSEELKLKVQEILNLDLKVIKPEIVKTDKIIYETSEHSKSEYYKLKEEKSISIPYNLSETMIEGKNKELFINFHEELIIWIEEQFEIISEGKAIRFNK